MTEYYSSKDKIYLAVDCIIFGIHDGQLSVLLTKRRFEPEKGKWSLMGGFVGKNESLDEAAHRVLTELTGLDNIYMDQVGAFGAVDRDPGERVVSVAYYALVNIADIDRSVIERHDSHWMPINDVPPLGFDHPEMIAKARVRIRRKFATEPLAFNLLPQLFTLTQMQILYETVLGETIDKRNFRKRIGEIKSIVPTDQIDKAGSRRGARLYKFDGDAFKASPKFKV